LRGHGQGRLGGSGATVLGANGRVADLRLRAVVRSGTRREMRGGASLGGGGAACPGEWDDGVVRWMPTSREAS
jgi:hypothetical protein